MKPMKMPRAHRVTSFLMLMSLATSLLVGCPAGTKTSVEAGVSATVDPAHCKEVQGEAGLAANTSSTVLLDCTTVTGSGTVRIEFPRKSWWDIKLSTTGVDAGPGK